MELAAKLDDIGKPAWIALMILGFVLWWPAGLGVLGYLIWSGRMGCWKHERRRWREEGMNKVHHAAERWAGRSGRERSSGNAAFDEYRDQTLRRLEEEQREFQEFLERLRVARDKAEFDQFLSERRRRPEGSDSQVQA